MTKLTWPGYLEATPSSPPQVTHPSSLSVSQENTVPSAEQKLFLWWQRKCAASGSSHWWHRSCVDIKSDERQRDLRVMWCRGFLQQTVRHVSSRQVSVCVMTSYEPRLITIDNLLIVSYCLSDNSRLLHMMEEKWITCLSLSYLSVRRASSSMWMASWCVGPPWSQLLGELSGSSWTVTTTSFFPLSSSPMQEAARDTTKPSSCLTCWTSR